MLTHRRTREESVKELSMRQWVLAWMVICGSVTLGQSDHTIPNYVISSGGGSSTSATHSVRATLGEPVTGAGDSPNHSIRAGFFMAVIVPICGADGDSDGDGHIDLDDFKVFSGCMSGPGGDPEGAQCRCFHFDSDTDVDLIDFGFFQRAFTGL